jgi:hypothetical protein
VDDAGALRAGPRSAGAVPGPACFGRGGTEATVTDAHVVLGHIDARPLSGGVALDAGAAHAAVRALAERVDRAAAVGDGRVRDVARALVAAADAAMARALRRVSVERGVDPRGLVLVAFGGGGALHACALAERVGVTRVLVPPHAGVLSAVGLAAAPDRREALASVVRPADALSAADVRAVVDTLAARAGAGAERQTWVRARYAGQGHELEVPVRDGDDGPALAARFAAVHRARSGFTLPSPVEVVSARHAASTPGARPRFERPRRCLTIPRRRRGPRPRARRARVGRRRGSRPRDGGPGRRHGPRARRVGRDGAADRRMDGRRVTAGAPRARRRLRPARAQRVGARGGDGRRGDGRGARARRRVAQHPRAARRVGRGVRRGRADGRQAAHIPVHLGAMPEAVAAVRARGARAATCSCSTTRRTAARTSPTSRSSRRSPTPTPRARRSATWRSARTTPTWAA